MKRSFLKGACIVLLSGLVSSCGGDKKRPPRKQLPTLTDAGSWEGSYGRSLQDNVAGGQENGSVSQGNDVLNGSSVLGGMAIPPNLFHYSNDTLVSGQSFVALAIPDPAADSIAWAVVKSYEPFAGGAFLLMQQQGKKGAVLDFRSTGADGFRSHYVVKDILGNSLSVIFLWDNLSADRAAGFMNELKQLPGIRCTALWQ